MVGGLAVTRPVSVWNRPLGADFRSLFKALGKMAVHGYAGDWVKAGIDAADALSAVGLKDDPGGLAWLLIRRALTRAIFDLVGEQADLLLQDLDDLAETIDLSIENAELCIDAGFFESPRQLPLLEQMRQPLREWLVGAGLDTHKAEVVAARLDSYFVFSLNDEWRRRPNDYQAVQQALDTPFTRAEQRERAWRQYEAWLERQIDEPVFDEAFSLRQVYIPLRAYWEERRRQDPEERRTGRSHDEDMIRHVVDLETAVRSWIESGDRHDAIRVISGGPGNGKSSFTKMLAARMVRERPDLRVLLVPLHLFEPEDDLLEALERFAADDPFIPSPLIDPGGERLLVFFDGLDELAMQGRIAQEITRTFVRQLGRTVDRLNQRDLRLQVLLSGREVVVQAHRDELQRREQILHLLGYVIGEEERECFDDPDKRLTEDQRNTWWQRFGALTGHGDDGLPEELRRDELHEITAQPLLNYLFALSHRRGKVDISNESSLNLVYQDLLSAVYERGWQRPGRHPAITGLPEEDFIRILEEIALATWHGDGRTTTVQEIEAHSGGRLKRLLEVFQEGSKAGITRLLTAFYFRQSGLREGSGAERTFEFTHKSFGEYLTARHIVRALKTIVTQVYINRDNPDVGWDHRQALVEWAKICGPTALDEYLIRFLRAEFVFRGKADCGAWQALLQGLITTTLHSGMPMERIDPRPSYQEEARQARNAEEALLATVNAAARVTKQLTKISWSESTTFGTWIKRLHGQRLDWTANLPLGCLAWMDLSDQDLVAADFHRADLRGADLSSANLSSANLSSVDLSSANLSNLTLHYANLTKTNLHGSDLRGVDLREANLHSSDLRAADLRAADLRGAELSGAWLNSADLREADMSGADLREAELMGANLRGAYLFDTDLSCANLMNTKVSQMQIDVAHGNTRTQLPDHISQPKLW